MITKEILEKLIYDIPSVKHPLSVLGVLSKDRMLSPKNRMEFNNILSVFDENAKIISVFGQVQLTAIIQPEIRKRGKIPVIFIRGIHCQVIDISKTELINNLNVVLNLRDYVPDAFVKKIIYIDHFDKESNVYGMVFSEYTFNKWTLGDPFKIGEKNLIKMPGSKILRDMINNLYLDIKEKTNGNN